MEDLHLEFICPVSQQTILSVFCELRALICGHHFMVPGMQGSGGGASVCSCLLPWPSAFACLPLILVLIILSLNRLSFSPQSEV